MVMYNLCFNNISVILGWSNSFVNKTRALIKPRVPRKNYGLATSFWQTLSHSAVHMTTDGYGAHSFYR
jgi:hypothetical protein